MLRHVEVRNRFDGGWTSGHQLEEVIPMAGTEQFRIRRCSDGRVLPGLFSAEEIRLVDDSDRRVAWLG
jgi:hypothetical protein